VKELIMKSTDKLSLKPIASVEASNVGVLLAE
jgi:hypothetical protein